MTTREEVIVAAKEAGIRKRLLPAGTNEMWCMEDDAVRFYAIAFQAGATSRDAELVEAQATILTMRDSIWEALQQRDQLRAELESLKQDAGHAIHALPAVTLEDLK